MAKESNAVKPRIAELLGVNVGEKFFVNMGSSRTSLLYVTESGDVTSVEDDYIFGNTLAYAINHPECVIRDQYLTPNELEICKVIGAKWVSLDNFSDWVFLWKRKPAYDGEVYSGSGYLAKVADDLFPSMSAGSCVRVDNGGTV